MATVDFTRLWLSPAADPSAGRGFRVHTIEHDPAVNVSIRAYAGGNLRAVSTPGAQRHTKITTAFLTVDDVAVLKAWQGALLCLRTPDGEKFYGCYTDPAFPPRASGLSMVTFTFDEITYSEAV